MPQFHIDEVCPKGAVYPMVVHFQNGYINDSFKTNDCVVFENEENGKMGIATDVNEMVYAGEEEREELGKTLILARNKITGKVRLIEVGNVELKAVLKSSLDTTDAVDTSYLELSRKFGSKKHKKIMEQREKLKMNVTTVTEQMQNVTDNVTEDQLDLSTYNKPDSDEFYIPSINREATKVEEVYDLDLILSEEQYEKIFAELENAEYTKDLNPFLKSIAANKLSQRHTVLLIYANALLQLYATLMKDIGKKNYVACQHSVTLNEIVMKNFLSNVNGKRGRSPQYKDKALCHALVFILLVNNYKFNFDEMCQQLKLTPRTVHSKVALTGASLVTVGTKKVAQLKLPLNRPPMRRKSAKF